MEQQSDDGVLRYAFVPDGQGRGFRIAGLCVLIDLKSTIFSCRLRVLGKAMVDSVPMGQIAALLLAPKFLSALQVTGYSGRTSSSHPGGHLTAKSDVSAIVVLLELLSG